MDKIAIEITKERIEELKKDIIEYKTLELESKNRKDKFRYSLKATECECLLDTHIETLKDLELRSILSDLINND